MAAPARFALAWRYPGPMRRHARLHPSLERGGEPARPCSTSCAASCRTRTCSSSTTARPTAPPTSRGSTAPRCSRSARTAACAPGSPPATRGRSSTSTRTAVGSTPTASTRPPSCAGCSSSSSRASADVAVGSRFVSGPGYEPYRYEPEGIRKLGTGLLRRSMRGRARPPLQRRDERPLRRVGEGAPRALAAVRERRAGGRGGTAPARRRACASRRCRSTCASGRAASRS